MNIVRVEADGRLQKCVGGTNGTEPRFEECDQADAMRVLHEKRLAEGEERQPCTATRGKFSKLDPESDDEPEPEEAKRIRKVTAQIMLTQGQHLYFHEAKFNVDGQALVRHVRQLVLDDMKTKESLNLEDIELSNISERIGGTDRKINLDDTITPEAQYCFVFKTKTEKEPMVARFKLLDKDGNVVAEDQRQIPMGDPGATPERWAFSVFANQLDVDFNTVTTKCGEKSFKGYEPLTEPGFYEVTVKKAQKQSESHVLYHFKLIFRSSMVIRCFTIECVPMPKAGLLWQIFASANGLDPQKVHKLGIQRPDGIENVSPDQAPEPYGFFVISYSG